MRTTASKYCRRLAEALTVGTRPIGYQLDKRKKTVYVKGEPVQIERGVIQLSPGCTRWVYKMLKRRYRRGELKLTDRFENDVEVASKAVVDEVSQEDK